MFGQIRPAVKNLLTVASEWTQNQTFTRLNQGTSPQSAIKLRNTTPAANGAQQVSPAVEWEGRGFSSGTSTSIPFAYRAYTLPVQGNPATGSFKIQSSLNNAAYLDVLTHLASGTGGKPYLTSHAYTVISTDNSSTIDTLQSLNVTSSGSTNHIVMSYGSTIRAGWSVSSQGTTDFRTAGTSPLYNFNLGSSITSQTMIAQLYSNGYYSSYSGYFGQQLTAGSPDTSVTTTFSVYGSTAFKGVLVNSSSYTLSQSETMVYCDPSNANFCTGVPSTVCSAIISESPCTAKNSLGCSWNPGSPCSDYNGNGGSCTGTPGCVWSQTSCSGADNTTDSTCTDQNNAYGGSCSYDTTTCPSYTTIATCQSEPGCTANTSSCSAFSNTGDCNSQFGCSAVVDGDCTTLSDGGGDGTSCATQSECSYDSGSGVCSGSYFTACNGDYLANCSGELCQGEFANGNCTGAYGASCQGFASCSNLTNSGSSACNAEGCTWTVGITVTLPLSSNSLRGTTGRAYSIVHVGSTGTCSIAGQTNENIFQYGNMTLFKKGDKVLLHNQNISYPCSVFATQTPCEAQSPCNWRPICSTFVDQSSCEAEACSWNGDTNVCEGRTTAFCEGSYTTTDRWFAHSLERGLNYVAKTSGPYTLLDIDDVVNCTSGTFTLNLPSAALLNGKTYYLQNTGAGTITVDPSGSELIHGASTLTISAGGSAIIVSNSVNWLKF